MTTSPPTSPDLDDELAKALEMQRQQEERIAKLKADKLERERIAKEKAEALEKERLAKEAQRLELEKIAKEKEERLRVEQAAKALEDERLRVKEKERVRVEKLKKLNKDRAKSKKLKIPKEVADVLKKYKPVEEGSDYETEEMPHEMIGDESGNENDGPPSKRKKARTDLECIANFIKYDFVGTTYPSSETTHTLGIHGDVASLLLKCGLSTYMTMAEPTYPAAAAEFLTTIKFHPTAGAPLLKSMGGGYINFVIAGETYTTSLLEISTLFGFPPGNPNPISIDAEENLRIWTLLTGSKTFKSGAKQNMRIRNPAISYARRAIAEAFFSRTKTGPASVNDMNLLTLGLQPYLSDNLVEGAEVRGDTACASLAYVLVMHLTSYKWKMSMCLNRNSEPTPLCIGGPITAIMRQKKVTAIDWDAEVPEKYRPRFMDLEYLHDQRWLAGSMTSPRHYYKVLLENGEALIELPNLALTSIDEFDNISFTPPAEHLITPSTIETPVEAGSSDRATASSLPAKKRVVSSAAKGKAKAVVTFTKEKEDELEKRLTEKLERQWQADFEKKVADELEKLRPKLIADLTPLIAAQLKRDKSAKSSKSTKSDKHKKNSSKAGTFKLPSPPPAGTSQMLSSSTMPTSTSSVAPAKGAPTRASPGIGSSTSAQASPQKKTSSKTVKLNTRGPGP